MWDLYEFVCFFNRDLICTHSVRCVLEFISDLVRYLGAFLAMKSLGFYYPLAVSTFVAREPFSSVCSRDRTPMAEQTQGQKATLPSPCLFIPQSTDATGERHAEADPPQLHRHPGLRPGAHGPVLHTSPLLPERLPRRLGERGLSSEAHHGARCRRAPRGRVPQTGPDHLHCHVPSALPVGAAHCVLYQLPAAELLLRLHAI